MATRVGNGLVAHVKKLRGVEAIQHESAQNDVSGTLERIGKFLREHETQNPSDATHVSFEVRPSVVPYVDWWMENRPLHKLAIAEDNTLDALYKYISVLYNMGIPLTLSEKLSPEIRFVQEIDIWGSKDSGETISAEKLFRGDRKFIRMLGQIMCEIYPKVQLLDVLAFDATGLSETKGIEKTSIRLVWPKIIVDRKRGGQIRDYIVCRFKGSTDEGIRDLARQLLGYHQDNTWFHVFSDALYSCSGRKGDALRMPLCDRVRPLPIVRPEGRPFAPFGMIRFHNGAGDAEKVETICHKDGETGLWPDDVEWLKQGCIRADAGTPLTEWEQPLAGESISQASQSQVIRVRTGGGSEAPRPRRREAQESQEVAIKRSFDGTPEDFEEHLIQHLGRETGTIIKGNRSVTWTLGHVDPSLPQIEFRDGTVHVRGKVQQTRSLLRCIDHPPIAPFTPPQGRQSATGSLRQAPSAAFAPSVASQSQAQPQSIPINAAEALSRDEPEACPACPPSIEPTLIVRAKADFEPEGYGELGLQVGDDVSIIEDSMPGSDHDLNRWVWGKNERTQERGWFPLNFAN